MNSFDKFCKGYFEFLKMNYESFKLGFELTGISFFIFIMISLFISIMFIGMMIMSISELWGNMFNGI